jgi:hypothetical protein
MTFSKDGPISLDAVSWQLKTDVEHALANEYRQTIATALGGEIREQSKVKNVYVGSKIMTANDLRLNEDAVVDAIERLIQQLRELE